MELVGRVELARHFNSLGFKKGAEIGVSEGDFSEVLLTEIPKLCLYCIDIWESKERFNKAVEKLKRYDARFLRGKSMDMISKIADNSLDFVFIDADHRFDYVMEDIIGWSRKVKPGGIISGHDYYNFHESGVIESVRTYTSIHKLKFELTGIIPESSDDRQPSFYWTKPL
jgi:predicted O-methyltransferase YrrM